MTFDYKTLPVINKNIDALTEVEKFLRSQKQLVTRFMRKDRRNKKYDRREGVRQGVIVILSTETNRRSGIDRRAREWFIFSHLI